MKTPYTDQELINEALNRGYKKGTVIEYFPGENKGYDHVEGGHFEVDQYGNLRAYTKPKHERKGFDDERYDTLYFSESNQWTKIIEK